MKELKASEEFSERDRVIFSLDGRLKKTSEARLLKFVFAWIELDGESGRKLIEDITGDSQARLTSIIQGRTYLGTLNWQRIEKHLNVDWFTTFCKAQLRRQMEEGK